MQTGQRHSRKKMPAYEISVREKGEPQENSDLLKPQSERTQTKRATDDGIHTPLLRTVVSVHNSGVTGVTEPLSKRRAPFRKPQPMNPGLKNAE
jgi:hypothetical protein